MYSETCSLCKNIKKKTEQKKGTQIILGLQYVTILSIKKKKTEHRSKKI